MMPPAALGRLLSELAPRPGERALVVGSGTGYSAAVLEAIGLDVVALESDEAWPPPPRRRGSRRSSATCEGLGQGCAL